MYIGAKLIYMDRNYCTCLQSIGPWIKSTLHEDFITVHENLANIQFKVLDVFRPLVYAWCLIWSDEASEEHPLHSAVVCSMNLLGHCSIIY